jgi:hypothetical protein
MSQSQQPGTPGRYQRSSNGLVGAMIVTVVLVLAFVGIRSLTSDNVSTPVEKVDYLTAMKAGRADHKLMTVAPERLPSGWKATSANYVTGMSPSWHLGLLTAGNKYVGVEEAQTSTDKLAEEHVDVSATRGKDVTIAGQKWQTWTDGGGDYAVARSLVVGGTTVESWMVVGTAPEKEIRDFAGTLVGVPVPSQPAPSPSASPTGTPSANAGTS